MTTTLSALEGAAPSPTLSAAMRAGSAEAHRRAESSPFVVALLAGHVDRFGYAAYLLRLREVYARLEHHVRRLAGHELVAAVSDPVLERVPAIDLDLAYWACDAERPATSPALTAYQDRLDEAAERAELLLAHHYTRYLGDLAGGQAIGRAVRRAYGVGSEGLAFYDFPGIEKPAAYRRSYRARLDRLPLSARQRRALVAEVGVAFELNRAMFDELHEQHEQHEL